MKKHVVLLAAAGFVSLPGIASAAAPAGPSIWDVFTNSGITASGYVSGGYQTGFNNGDSLGSTRAFDSKTDSFTLNQAALTISSLPTEGFGALVNVIVGDDATVLNGSYGDGSGKFNLTQAFVQYAVGNLTVIGGRYVTLAGYEVINDSTTPHISRSLLFQVAEPLVHTGIRAAYKVSDQLTGYLGVANSGASGLATDNNKLKTVEAGVALTPIAPLSIGIYDYYGIDGGSGSHVKTNYLDVVAAFKVSDALTLALNGDYLHIFGPGSFPSTDIKGVAAYGAFQVTELIGLRGRAEFVNFDSNGEKSSNIKTLTGTVVVSPAKSFDILGEVRYDIAKKSDKIFPDGMGTTDDGEGQTSTFDKFKHTQGDVAIKAIYKFGT